MARRHPFLLGAVILSAFLLSVFTHAETPETRSLKDAKTAGAARSSYRNPNEPSKTIAAPKAYLEEYRKHIAPLLKKTCTACHGAETQEAGFRVDILDPDLIQGKDASWWLEVMQVLSNSEMPPADDTIKLADSDRAKIIDWLSGELLAASQAARSKRAHSSFRRLTRYEFNHALQDLLGLPYDFARDLPPETTSEDGFQNSADMLHMSAEQLATYRELARKALLKATVRGKQPKPVYYAITMDRAADLMLGVRNRKSNDEKAPKPTNKFNKNAPNFVDLETELGVNGQYRYTGGRYSWRPVKTRPKDPTVSSHVLNLPAGTQQILDLGDSLPDTGNLRLRVRACRTSADELHAPDLRISFGFQPSNDSRVAFPVGTDVTIRALPGEFQFYEFEFPLGEILRNAYRGEMKLGALPNPSEYLVFQNLQPNRNHGGLQIDYIEITAPFYKAWPPASHKRVFFESPNQADETQYAREVLTRLMTRAWRRPITDAEIAQKLKLFESLRPVCEDSQEALVEVLATVLASPKFLYWAPKGSDAEALNDFELASRLSLFLWSSIPDKELLQIASEGKLSDPKVLAQQAERMLDDPKAARFARHFTRQWLGMELLDFLKVDRSVHSQFDGLLKEAMEREPIEFVQHAVENNCGVMDFLHADYTMANERLARHYGIPSVYGSQFRKVAVQPEHHRGGLLTQAGLLAMNSDGKDSHPLKRGIWLLENLLHDPPPPPPPAVPEIDLTDPDILKLTLKERMEDHRSDPACMSCHSRIDPWGVAFENFDAIGRWRDRLGDKPVDATSTLFNGRELAGIDGLKRYLLENRQDQFARAMTHKLTSYALGRPLGFSDRADVENITAELRRKGDGMRSLILLIVTNDLFRSR